MADRKNSLASVSLSASDGSEESSVASADRRATLKIKDETIRRRAETQIAGSAGTIATVTGVSRSRRRQRRYRPGTVSSLNPAFAVALNENATVYEAAAYMAAKRTDAVLVTNDENLLSGIVTDKDITYRCLAEGLNPSVTPVSRIMTPNPVSVSAQASATDALNKMVAGHFRHLPVVDNEDDYADGDLDENSSDGVVGILDITKCLYNALEKLEVAFESSQQLDPALENRSSLSDDSRVEVAQYAEYLKQQLASPDLAGMLSQQSTSPPVVGLHASVMEAARKMKVTRETAVLVFSMDTMPSGLGQLAGIFTTKDVVLRVVAAKNEPSSTPVLRVMTPRPDCVSPETPVLDALRKMHTGKYLHLPVVDDSGMVEGLVDVLKLTYSTLDQLSVIRTDGAGPVWNTFWDTAFGQELDDDDDHIPLRPHVNNVQRPRSTFYDSALGMDSLKLADDESILGPEDSASMFGGHNNSYPDPGVDYAYNRPMGAQIPRGIQTRRGPPSVLPAPLDNESLSPTQVQVIPETFVYKLKDEDTGKVHRIVSSTTSLQELSESVRVKLGWPPHDTFSLCPDSARISTSTISLSYVDDEGDYVHLSTDTDLADAVAVAISMRWQRLILSVDAQRMRQQMTAISDITGIASRLLGQRSHLKNQRHLYSDTVSDCDSQGVATAPAGPVPALGSPNASSAGGGTVSVSTGSATGRVSGSTSPVVQQPQSVTMFGNPDRSPILRHASPVLRHRLPPHFPPSFAHMPPSHFEGMKAEDVQKRDEIAMIAGAGVAVVCAFLLGRMFKV